MCVVCVVCVYVCAAHMMWCVCLLRWYVLAMVCECVCVCVCVVYDKGVMCYSGVRVCMCVLLLCVTRVLC